MTSYSLRPGRQKRIARTCAREAMRADSRISVDFDCAT